MTEEPATATLYVVATPIGNLRDITLRALDVLRGVDLVAAEDTRVTVRLLKHYDIEKPMLPVHEHNEHRSAARVINALAQGKSVALVSDAGTPGVSDPGALVVAAVRKAGYRIVAIPGPSALAAAWSVAAMVGAQLLFAGFLPAQAAPRRRALEALAPLPFPLVFYEAPHRIVETAHAMCDVFGADRRVVVARELTKLHECTDEMRLGDLARWLESDTDRRRGEFVLVVSAAPVVKSTDTLLAERLVQALAAELAPSQAARLAARITGVSRSELYDIAVARASQT